MKGKLAASFELIGEAISEVVRRRVALIAAAFPPMICLLLYDLLTAEIASASVLTYLLFSLLALPLYAVFATVVHRVILLGEHSLPHPWGLFWTERETRFLGWLFGIWLLYAALAIPQGFIRALFSPTEDGMDLAWIGTILSYIVVAYFYGRFALVLPATAVDRRSDFRHSWYMSRGHGMTIAMALVLPAMILIPVEWALYGTIDESLWPAADVVWLVIALPVFAIEIAILSLAYSKLVFPGDQ